MMIQNQRQIQNTNEQESNNEKKVNKNQHHQKRITRTKSKFYVMTWFRQIPYIY